MGDAYNIDTPTRKLRDIDDLVALIVDVAANTAASEAARFQTITKLLDTYTVEHKSPPAHCPRCKGELLAPYRSRDGKAMLRDCSRCMVAYEVLEALAVDRDDLSGRRVARLAAIHDGDERVNVNDPPLAPKVLLGEAQAALHVLATNRHPTQAALDDANGVRGRIMEYLAQVPSGVTFEEALDELIGKAREAGAASAIKTRMELDVHAKRSKTSPSDRRGIRNDSKHADTGLAIGRRNFLKNWGR